MKLKPCSLSFSVFALLLMALAQQYSSITRKGCNGQDLSLCLTTILSDSSAQNTGMALNTYPEEVKEEVLAAPSLEDPVTTTKEDKGVAFATPFDTTEPTQKPQESNSTIPPPPLPLDLACSCWNPNNRKNCCEHYFHPTHKMGYFVADKLTRNFRHEFRKVHFAMKQLDTETLPTLQQILKQRRVDRRHVVITRNIYDAIASGYLYHKVGHECHLSASSMEPWEWTTVPNLHYFWKNLSFTPDPPHHDRSLCIYLANETMMDGLKVYIDWIFRVYYNAIEDFLQFNSNQAALNTTSLAVHVCFDDLCNSNTSEAALQKIVNTFFPGGNSPNYEGWNPGTETYEGGHSTSHDSELRGQIRRVTEELDGTFFKGKVAAFHEKFPCGV